jgi:hypothetical protein
MGFFALSATPDTLEMIDLNIARNAGEADQIVFRDILIENPRYLNNIFPLPESSFPTGLLYQSVKSDNLQPVELAARLRPLFFMRIGASGFKTNGNYLHMPARGLTPRCNRACRS